MPAMQAIKNIIFDFGGVFIDVDYKRTEKAFIDAGILNFSELYSQHAASPLFEDLETGRLADEDFYRELRRVTGSELPTGDITSCWNRILGDYFPEAIDWAAGLQGKYRLFLFSNTNIIHYRCFMEIYRRQFGRDDFNQLFEKAWYSHEIGVRKPYPEAYEWVLKDAGLKAEETLFIDDTLTNIEGAREAGLQTIHLKPPMRVWELGL